MNKGVFMIKEERKVGQKGQVVIPKTFRKNYKIKPGTKIIFEATEEGIKIQREEEKTEEVFKEVAETGKKHKGKIKPHEAHEEEMEERL